ncbi:MAG: alanine/ornithine racemase family PLP-dependent enzyme [Thalassovita sp.]|nr:alanine/ornithine racemase family PLP-dependent enzyme [Thalassovita sp.]
MHPYLTIALDKIEHNARTISGLCGDHGIAVTGVTKGVCGQPEVAAAMLRGGVVSIGESRFENTTRLRDADIVAPVMQLRLPPLSGAAEIVAHTDISLNSELAVLTALSEAARAQGRVHEVILMVDLGDLREGIMPEALPSLVSQALQLKGIRIVGLGTNLACFSGVVPSEDSMTRLVELADGIEKAFGLSLRWISGANSSGLDLIAAGRMPERVNHARIGEAILLGRETVRRRAWPNTFQDAFVLHSEILELQAKPSAPLGEQGQDAFGGRPAAQNQGTRLRALLNIGREDIGAGNLTPLAKGISILGASSGYLVIDVSDADDTFGIGDELRFFPDYGALLAAMTSEYVKKRLVSDDGAAGDQQRHG